MRSINIGLLLVLFLSNPTLHAALPNCFTGNDSLPTLQVDPVAISRAVSNASAFGDAASPAQVEGMLITDNEDDLLIREKLIQRARPTDPISYLTFEFTYGRSSRELIKLLADQARARNELKDKLKKEGKYSEADKIKDVTLIVDGHFADHSVEADMLQWAADQGVVVKIFNPLSSNLIVRYAPWNIWRTLYINHRKLLVVGDRLLMGGRNTASGYLEDFDGPDATKKSYIDNDILLRDGVAPEAAKQAQAIFDQMSNESDNTVPIKPNPACMASGNSNSQKSTCVYRNIQIYPTDVTSQNQAKHSAFIPASVGISTRRIPNFVFKDVISYRILSSDWGRHEDAKLATDGDQFRDALHQAIKGETNAALAGNKGAEIYIETPYMEPDNETIALLEKALDAGVKVRIRTNSVLTTDNLSKNIPVIMEALFQKLIKNGAGIEYTNGQFLHAKDFGFKAQGLMYLGSHNGHKRSGEYDREVMVEMKVNESKLKEDHGLDLIGMRDLTWRQYQEKDPTLLIPWHTAVDDIINVLKSPQNYDKDTVNFVFSDFIAGLNLESDWQKEQKALASIPPDSNHDKVREIEWKNFRELLDRKVHHLNSLKGNSEGNVL